MEILWVTGSAVARFRRQAGDASDATVGSFCAFEQQNNVQTQRIMSEALEVYL